MPHSSLFPKSPRPSLLSHGRKRCLLAFLAAISLLLPGCRQESVVYPPDEEQRGDARQDALSGFYLLNEGNMGSNKASLDHYSYADALYSRNIYAQANPSAALELGDVANDMKAYRDRLWITVNCSNKVEVLDLQTARRLGQVDIPNCRYLAFQGDNAYVTSYAGPVLIDEDYAQLGFVARIDANTLRETGRVTVGFQPDGIAVSGNRLIVANSGGYRVPNYENTLSIIDLDTFTETDRWTLAINLNQVVADNHGHVWVSSRGDYFNVTPRLFCLDALSGELLATFERPASGLWLDGDLLYTVASAFSFETMANRNCYSLYDTRTLELVSDSFVDDSQSDIRLPYGIAVNPESKEILVTDARTYVNPGYLHCFATDGRHLWKVRTGDIPSKIAFIPAENPAEPK